MLQRTCTLILNPEPVQATFLYPHDLCQTDSSPRPLLTASTDADRLDPNRYCPFVPAPFRPPPRKPRSHGYTFRPLSADGWKHMHSRVILSTSQLASSTSASWMSEHQVQLLGKRSDGAEAPRAGLTTSGSQEASTAQAAATRSGFGTSSDVNPAVKMMRPGSAPTLLRRAVPAPAAAPHESIRSCGQCACASAGGVTSETLQETREKDGGPATTFSLGDGHGALHSPPHRTPPHHTKTAQMRPRSSAQGRHEGPAPHGEHRGGATAIRLYPSTVGLSRLRPPKWIGYTSSQAAPQPAAVSFPRSWSSGGDAEEGGRSPSAQSHLLPASRHASAPPKRMSGEKEGEKASGGTKDGQDSNDVRKMLRPKRRNKGYDTDGRLRVEQKTWVY